MLYASECLVVKKQCIQKMHIAGRMLDGSVWYTLEA